MLQYLIIILDDSSPSFCHYENSKTKRNLIPIDKLKQGIFFAMTENLMIQFVYPDYELPKEYIDVVESIDHFNISPIKEDADVWITSINSDIESEVPVVIRLGKDDLFANIDVLSGILEKVPRLNIILSDIESFDSNDFQKYDEALRKMSTCIESLLLSGKGTMLNLLTDRLVLNQMNNCGAGDSTITLAPNGEYYLCPAYYYDHREAIGDVEKGLQIKNAQLLQLDHAPICCHCDAYQCKRCIWLNQKTTLEVNTPSHEQCVLAHIERNVSRDLLGRLRQYGNFFPNTDDIAKIDYLDPFENKDKWQ